MSGRKESDFVLDQEQEQRLNLLQKCQSVRSEVDNLKKRLAEELASAPEGLRATFQGEATQAEQWLREAAACYDQRLGADSALSSLQHCCSLLERVAAEGREIRQKLTVAFTQRADALGRQLRSQLTAAEQLFMSRQQVLALWFGPAMTDKWQRDLEGTRRQLQRRNYTAVERALEAFQQELEAKSREAEEQEAKHQRRLYLVTALRKACAAMGFRELEPPHPEKEADRGCRILYKVDTLDRGRIAFAITLDMIHSFAGTAENQCFEEFDKLSEFLKAGFGVHTEFRYSDSRPRPELRHKGQRALPKTHNRSTSRAC